MTARSVASSLAVLVGLAAVSCGGHSPSSSSTPPPTTVPTTLPNSGAVGASCSLGNGTQDAYCTDHPKQEPKLLHYVETAIDLLIKEKPQLFDVNVYNIPGQYKVLDDEGYLNGVVDNIRRQGACAERDWQDVMYERIFVKDSNDRSETFDVILSSGFIRRGNSAFVQDCAPASFPLPHDPVEVPPAGSGCGRPYPPPVTKFNCKLWLPGSEFYTTDSTPIVQNEPKYCEAIGYTDGRPNCPVRLLGAPDREACETWRVGHAKDTGRPGPTWTNADTGEFCTGLDTPSGCQNSPVNQYQLWVSKTGRYRVAAENDADCIVKFNW